MKLKFTILFFVIFEFLFSINIKTAAQNSSPKFFLNPSKQKVIGICVDVMRAIEKIDPSIKFLGDQNFMPLSRIERDLEEGTLDCFVGFIKNEEREKKYIYIDIPIYYVKDILISRKDDKIEIKNLEDIKKLNDNKILMVLGVGQVQKFKSQGYNIDDGGKTLEDNLKKLMSNRGRFMYQSEIEMLEAIRKMKLEDRVKIHPIESEISGRYIAFSKKTPRETIIKVTKALEQLRDNGTLNQIFKKYVY